MPILLSVGLGTIRHAVVAQILTDLTALYTYFQFDPSLSSSWSLTAGRKKGKVYLSLESVWWTEEGIDCEMFGSPTEGDYRLRLLLFQEPKHFCSSVQNTLYSWHILHR